MTEVNKLRGLVYSRYKRKSEFAKAMGMTIRQVDYMLDRPERLKIEQVHKIIDTLGLEHSAETYSFFMPIATTKN